jgi:antigen flippase
VVALLIARRRRWWPERPLSHGFESKEARLLLSFVPMALVGALTQPLVQLLIRHALADKEGMVSVGLLQGVMRISDMYVGMVTSVFSMYYLPRFSEIRNGPELRRELQRALLVIVPSVSAVGGVIYLLRDLIIHVVLTAEFIPMRDLFGWQMAGNVFKVTAWLFGALLVAKAHPIALAVFELATTVVWWQSALWLIDLHGTVGAPQAYALTYFIYSCVALLGIAHVLRRMEGS